MGAEVDDYFRSASRWWRVGVGSDQVGDHLLFLHDCSYQR